MGTLLNNEKNYKTKPIVFFILIGFGILYLGIVAVNHYLFRTYTFDYGTYNFAFYDYSHFRVSHCTIYPDSGAGSFFQDHFSLTLFTFIPFYWLLNWLTGSYTLLIIQWCIIMYGAWTTYKLIELKSGDYKFSLLALIYYFVLLGRINASNTDVNFAIIGGAVLPAFLYWFEREKIWPTIICFLFLILNREDFSLTLIFICIFLMLIHRKERFKLKFSTALFFASIVSLFLIFFIVIPSIEDEHKQYTLFNFSALGKTPGEAIRFVFLHPIRSVELLFINHTGADFYNNIKAEFYIVYLISGVFLLLYKPIYFIPFIPLIAKKMYNDEPIRWSVETYYSAEIVSILPIMIFLLLLHFRWKKIRLSIAALICISAAWVTIDQITTPNGFHKGWLGNTEKTNFLKKDFYKTGLDIKTLRKTMALIPDNASLSASNSIAPQVALREKIYLFPRVDDAEYIFVLKKGDNWPVTQEQFDAMLVQLKTSNTWDILADERQFLLLKKKQL